MKKTIGTLAGIALIALSGQAYSADTENGKKIYDRAFGRGCGTCHDIASNPQLTPLIQSGALDRARFEQVITDGKGGMPKALDVIMGLKFIQKKGLTKDQALDDLYEYLKTR